MVCNSLFISFTYYQLLVNCLHIGEERSRSVLCTLWGVVGFRFGYGVIDVLSSMFWLRFCFFFVLHYVYYYRGVFWFVCLDSIYFSLVLRYGYFSGVVCVGGRWVYGLLTNFRQFHRFFLFRRVYNGLEFNFKLFGRLPSIGFLVGGQKYDVVLREFCRLSIPVCGLVDTDMSSIDFAFPVVGNDNSYRSVMFFFSVTSRFVVYSRLLVVKRFFNFYG